MTDTERADLIAAAEAILEAGETFVILYVWNVPRTLLRCGAPPAELLAGCQAECRAALAEALPKWKGTPIFERAEAAP